MEGKLKCVRCGECCKARPCFLIPFGEERYDENGNHICPHFTVENGMAVCSRYETEIKSAKEPGMCSSYVRLKRLGLL